MRNPLASIFAVASAITPCGPFGSTSPSASRINTLGGSIALNPAKSFPVAIKSTDLNCSSGSTSLPLPSIPPACRLFKFTSG